MRTNSSFFNKAISDLSQGDTYNARKQLSILENRIRQLDEADGAADRALLAAIQGNLIAIENSRINTCNRQPTTREEKVIKSQNAKKVFEFVDGDYNETYECWRNEREQYRHHLINMHAWCELIGKNSEAKEAMEMLPLPPIPDSIPPSPSRLYSSRKGKKISIITPSYNSGNDIERAIQSVLAQDYDNWEHIVVDGGSTDNTIEILKSYSHINWISESDRGQVDAMNKGFEMSTGNIISYLNADDYYNLGTFSHISELLTDTIIQVVYGNVNVYSAADDTWWLNEPQNNFSSVLHHWEPNAFCVNPVGYFYRRRVQEKIPIRESDGAKHDLAFLMEAAWLYEDQSIKSDKCFGVFINSQDTQTAREQSEATYWSPENFAFINRFLDRLSKDDVSEFRYAQEKGYALRRSWLEQQNAATEPQHHDT